MLTAKTAARAGHGLFLSISLPPYATVYARRRGGMPEKYTPGPWARDRTAVLPGGRAAGEKTGGKLVYSGAGRVILQNKKEGLTC